MSQEATAHRRYRKYQSETRFDCRKEGIRVMRIVKGGSGCRIDDVFLAPAECEGQQGQPTMD